MKLTSYWLDTSKPFSGSAKGPVEGTYDVAVIGGGLTGSSAALALARKGARVILLEAGRSAMPPRAATAACATTASPRTTG